MRAWLERPRSRVRRSPAWPALLCLAALPVAAAGAEEDAALKQVVAELRRHEQRYANLAVEIKETYDIGDRKPLQSDQFSETIRKDTRTKFVARGDWFRCETNGTGLVTQQGFTIDRLTAFDGEKARQIDRVSKLGSIWSERVEDSAHVRPHLMLVRRADLQLPLSDYLDGQPTTSETSQRLAHRVSHRGEETYDGLACHVVFVETLLSSGKVHDARKFWLAKDRNLIPVRHLAYTYRFSQDDPVGECVVGQWRELEPGLWFPTDVRCTAYDKFAVRRKDPKKLQWRTRTVVEKIELDPKHERVYFSTVDVPKGTQMTEVEQGHIVRSWRQE